MPRSSRSSGRPGSARRGSRRSASRGCLSAQVLQGRCLPYGEGITFWPITEIVAGRGLDHDGRLADEARAKIARLLEAGRGAELVCERVSRHDRAARHAPRTEESFWALRRLFEAMAPRAAARPRVRGHPLGRADAARPARVPRRLVSGAPIMIVCLARPELIDARPLARQTARSSSSRSPRTEIEALAASALGSDRVDPAVVERVVEAADGNPLFAEEFARMLVDEGLLTGEDGVWSATRRPRRAVRAADDQRAPLGAPRPARRRRARGDAVRIRRRQGVLVGLGRATSSSRTSSATSATRLHALVRKRLDLPGRLDGDHGRGRVSLQPHPRPRRRLRGAVQESARGDARAPCGVAAREGRRVARRRSRRSSAITSSRLSGRAPSSRPSTPPPRRSPCARRGHLAAAGRRAWTRGDAHAAATLLGRAASLDEDAALRDRARSSARRSCESGALREAEEALERAVESASPARRHPARRPRGRRARAPYAFRTDPTWALDATRNAGRAGDRDVHASSTTTAGSRSRSVCSRSRTRGTASGRRWPMRSSAPSAMRSERATRASRRRS